MIINKYALNTG